MKKNYYELLQVQPDAHQAIIKTAYRTMMQELKMHPDLGGDNSRAQELNEAHAVLSDPEQRRAYDQAVLKPEGSCAATSQNRCGPQNKYAVRAIMLVVALLLAIAAAVKYAGHEKEPVWIGGGIVLSAEK